MVVADDTAQKNLAEDPLEHDKWKSLNQRKRFGKNYFEKSVINVMFHQDWETTDKKQEESGCISVIHL